MPSFLGEDIFGPCPASSRVEPPNARQVNAYPGVAGTEVLELGWRTAYTEFSGLWVAASPEDLGAFLGLLVALKRSAALGVLVDTRGLASPDAILEAFETVGESRWSPSHGGWALAYRIRFLHTGYVPAG